MVGQMDVSALADSREGNLANAVLLDVREPWEFALARIEGSVNIPMSTLAARVEEVRSLQQSAGTALVVICHHGMRSMQVAQFLARHGLENLINLNGGIEAWSARIDPTVPHY